MLTKPNALLHSHAFLVVQVMASVLQLQALASAQQRDEPLPVITALHEPSSGIEDVLWHATLSYHADMKADAASKAAKELQRIRTRAKKGVTGDELAAVSAAAAAEVTPPISLHLLRPDELKAGMITQTAVAPQLANVFSELFTQVREARLLPEAARTQGCYWRQQNKAGVRLMHWSSCMPSGVILPPKNGS